MSPTMCCSRFVQSFPIVVCSLAVCVPLLMVVVGGGDLLVVCMYVGGQWLHTLHALRQLRHILTCHHSCLPVF